MTVDRLVQDLFILERIRCITHTLFLAGSARYEMKATSQRAVGSMLPRCSQVMGGQSHLSESHRTLKVMPKRSHTAAIYAVDDVSCRPGRRLYSCHM
jgi:hypothetical protein